MFSFGLSFNITKTEIGLIALDVLVNERISFDGRVTRYAVEEGADISDHIKRGNKTVSISGLISASEAYAVNLFSRKSRLIDAIAAIEAMNEKQTPFTVITGLGQYDDMGMEDVSINRSNSGLGGNWIDISANFVRIRKVNLKTTTITDNAAGEKGVGTKGRSGETQAKAGTASQTDASTSTSTSTSTRTSSSARSIFNYIQKATAK